MSAHPVTALGRPARKAHWVALLGVQHASLRGEALALEEVLRAIASGVEGCEPAVAGAKLAAFHRDLVEHLACEEREDRLALALAGAPHWQRKADLLQGDHARFREGLAALLADAGTAREAATWGTILLRFEAFRRAFAAHEEIENEILQRVYLEDLGGGD